MKREPLLARALSADAPTASALRIAAQSWCALGRAAVVVEVADTRGSVPRKSGARMLVGAHDVLGTIGGGHLEWRAIAQARQMLSSGTREAGTQHVALGPTLGQCCGGTLTLRFAPLDAHALERWPAPAPRFHLQLYGAGHVGRAIAALLAEIDCRVQWIDEREDAFPAEASPAHIERVCVEPVEAEVDRAPANAHFLVLTHRHDVDLRITEAILRRGDFAWCGLIGSQSKRARFVHRFEQRGVPAQAIARLTCPIGLPGVAGKAPIEIAIAVLAQLLSITLPVDESE
jgi:xanthine dehydrogenase accessory factor